MTRAEKLSKKIGELVRCDLCNKKKVFNDKWRMAKESLVMCPECSNKNLDKVQVNI